MCKFEDFKQEFIEKYPNFSFDIIEQMIEKLENDCFESCNINGFNIYCSTEKIHSLQENVYIHFENENENIDFYLEYENGINNGTQLNNYSFTDLKPKKRTIEVLKDVKFDYERWRKAFGKDYNEREKSNLESVFESNFKSQVLKMIKEQSYDNYVTGGGTNKTDNHYSKFKSELQSKNVYWICIYEDEEVDVCFNNR